MVEPNDMIVPLLRKMQSDISSRFDDQDKRLERIEQRQKSFSQALAGDSLMSKMLVGEWEERIMALEKKMELLESRK